MDKKFWKKTALTGKYSVINILFINKIGCCSFKTQMVFVQKSNGVRSKPSGFSSNLAGFSSDSAGVRSKPAGFCSKSDGIPTANRKRKKMRFIDD